MNAHDDKDQEENDMDFDNQYSQQIIDDQNLDMDMDDDEELDENSQNLMLNQLNNRNKQYDQALFNLDGDQELNPQDELEQYGGEGEEDEEFDENQFADLDPEMIKAAQE